MLTKQEQMVANRVNNLLQQHGDTLRMLSTQVNSQRAAYISQIVAARPDIWTQASASAFPTEALEKIARQLRPDAFMANGLCVNCDEEEELQMKW